MNRTNQTRGTALVTGGAKRIGAAIALRLAHLTFNLALHCNQSKKEAQALAKQIRDTGAHCEIFACDLSDPQETSQLIEKVCRAFPDLNLLINSASVFKKSTLKTATLESLDEHFNINFKAPFILSRDFANLCKKGHIINILDTNVVKNKTHYLTYLLSKKSLMELTKAMAVELAPDIRVNAIAPGLILPPLDQGTDYLDRLAKNIPLKTKGDPRQIAQCVEFLVTNPYLTGQILFNDGGEHLI